ncbi:MAG TPA: metallophosphoesterase [Xanthobacteraceae bacterium]|nr:metallophosphoesterase [Xanthobacteraceae bacterium]
MFVLAHLSDPHLAPLPKPRWPELIGKRVTGYLNWQRKRRLIHRADVLGRIVADLKAQAPDQIAVTGDLVNIALAAEFPPARAFLEQLGSPHVVTLVPGNHDAYVRAAASFPRQHWGDYMLGDDADEFPFLRRRGPLALIGLSSAVPTPPFMATGHLGATQLTRLAALLDDCGGLFRVVLIHHPPASKPGRHFKRLTDGSDFRTTLARHGAELVIHGHDHERSLIELAGPRGRIPVVGVPSASEAPPGEHDPAGYNLYRIDGNVGAWRCEAISRGIAPDGESIAEVARLMLTG